MKIGQFEGEKDTDIKKVKTSPVAEKLHNYYREMVGPVAQSV